jgi:hypothetical protein
MKAYLWGAVILLFLSACSQDSILEGISDDSSHGSKIEQARIDLDNSNYDQVISDLSAIYTTKALDPEVGQLLASAYMGKAGIDLTIFISNSNSSGLNPFDVVASMISSSNVTINENGEFIDGTLMPNILDYITKAKDALQLMVDKEKSTNDDTIQLGIASAVHFIMYTGNNTADALNLTLYKPKESEHVPGQVPVPINTAAYSYYHTTKDYYWSYVNPGSYYAPPIQEDLININNAINAFSKVYPKPNEMRDRLNAFLHSALGKELDDPVTSELIMAYTSAGLNNYVQSLAK